MKMIFLLFPLYFISSYQIFPIAKPDNETLVEVLNQFKEASKRGYHISYYGIGSMKREYSFEGQVKLEWNQSEQLIIDAYRLKGTYRLQDVLGKRTEKVEIYQNKGEFWKIFHEQKMYLYTPNIKKSSPSTFKQAPLMVVKALRFMLKNKQQLQQKEVVADNQKFILLKCSFEGVTYSIWADPIELNIQKVTWKNEKWGKGEVIGQIDTGIKEQVKEMSFQVPLKDYDKKMIPTIGHPAPIWQASYHLGEKVNLSQLKGNVVLLDFWASWCSPCLRAIPSLEKFHLEYKDQGLILLGMNYHEKRNPQKTMDKLKATYPIVTAESIGKDYGILNWPSLFIIDKKGVLRDIHIGYHDEKTDALIKEWLEELLRE